MNLSDSDKKISFEGASSPATELATTVAALHQDWENFELLSEQLHIPRVARLLAEVVALSDDPEAGERALDLLAQLTQAPAVTTAATTSPAAQADVTSQYEEIVDLEHGFLFSPRYSEPLTQPPHSQPGFLWQGDDSAAIEEVCQVWGEHDYPSALTRLIATKGWVARAASTTREVRLVSALLAGHTQRIAHELGNSPTALELLIRLAAYEWEDTPPSPGSKEPPETSSPDRQPPGGLERLLENCPSLGGLARRYLEGPLAPATLVALASLWATSRKPYLLSLISHHHFLPTDPPYLGVLVALATGQAEFLCYEAGWIVAPLVKCLEDKDPLIREAAKGVLGQLKRVEAIETLCRLICEEEVPPLVLTLARRAGYLPRPATERALYLFMTGQWAEYEALDFDNFSLLATFYARVATPTLRRRIAWQIKNAGNPRYLAIVSSPSGATAPETYATGARTSKRPLSPGLTRSGAGTAAYGATSPASPASGVRTGRLQLELELLAANKAWAEVWQRVFDWPVAYAIKAVLVLKEAGWQPPAQKGVTRGVAEGEDEEERIFHRLADLAARLNSPGARAAGFSQLEADHSLPAAYHLRQLDLAQVIGNKQKLTALAFVTLNSARAGEEHAGLVLGAGRKLIIYNLHEGRVIKVFPRICPAKIRQLLYLPSLPGDHSTPPLPGWLVWADERGRLWGSEITGLLLAREPTAFRPRPIGQATAPLRNLVGPVGGRTTHTAEPLPRSLVSLDGAGRLVVWQGWYSNSKEEIHSHQIDLTPYLDGSDPGAGKGEVAWALSPNEGYLVLASAGTGLIVVDLTNQEVIGKLSLNGVTSAATGQSGRTVSAVAFTPDGNRLLMATTAATNKAPQPGPALALFELDWASALAFLTARPQSAQPLPTLSATELPHSGGQPTSQPADFLRPLTLAALSEEAQTQSLASHPADPLGKAGRPRQETTHRACLKLIKEEADTLLIAAPERPGPLQFVGLNSGVELGRIQGHFEQIAYSNRGYLLATVGEAKDSVAQTGPAPADKADTTSSPGPDSSPRVKAGRFRTELTVWDYNSVHLKELLFERGPLERDVLSLAGLEAFVKGERAKNSGSDGGNFLEEKASLPGLPNNRALPAGLLLALEWLLITLPWKFRHLIELDPLPLEPSASQTSYQDNKFYQVINQFDIEIE